ncbi:MAG: efflux RND transporter periplasmic adaptor subunit [Leptolyngbya sp. SIO1D8]|nr:efflux RND transporter periplasmic adaptor subunit [Leptolyngbya sp. SIO1D8]
MQNQASAKRLVSSRLWLWILLILGIFLTLSVLRTVLPSSPRPSREEAVKALTTPVAQEDLTIRIEGSGTVISIDTVNLSPKTTGRLDSLFVEQGDAVQTGQVLAQMDTGSLQAELERNQAQFAQAEADYARILAGNRQEDIRQTEAQVAAAESRRALATTQLERYRELAAQGAISQNDLDQYINDARTATANLQEAEQQLLEMQNGSRPEEIAAAEAAMVAAQAQVAITETQLEDANIRAPFDGVVSQIYATVGAIVTPTTTASATASATSSSILALSSGIEVEVEVTEADIDQVAIEQTVEIVADAFPNQTFAGRVKRIAPEAVIENNVTTFQVVVKLLTGLEDLRSGMTVDAIFIGNTVSDALMVPTVAIASEEGQLGVRVADAEGNSVFQPVIVGLTQSGKTQILSGLEAGDRVFLALPEGERQPTSVPRPF